jgi:hypothetical protein
VVMFAKRGLLGIAEAVGRKTRKGQA